MAKKQSIKRFIVRDPHGHIEQEDSFSVVGEVHVSIDGGVGEPSAESEYSEGVLTITLHNLKGEGISNISFTPSEEDGGENLLTITTDGGNTYTFPILNGKTGERGKGIKSIAYESTAEDGGENLLTITDDDDVSHEFVIRNGQTGNQGPQGIQGTSAIWDGNAEVLTELEHTTGQATNRAMSQKGITDSLDAIHAPLAKELDMQKIVPTLTYADGKISWDGKLVESTTAKYTQPIEVKRNDIVHIKGNRNDQYTFMAAWVVKEDVLYNGIYAYTSTSGSHEITFRVLEDGYISICLAKNYSATVEIWRGSDEFIKNILPPYLNVPKDKLLAGTNNIYHPAHAVNSIRLIDTGNYIQKSSGYWTTGFIELPNTDYLKLSYFPERAVIYAADGTRITNVDTRSPIYLNRKTNSTAKYIRFCFNGATYPYEDRHRLVVSAYHQETNIKPYSVLDRRYIAVEPEGIIQLSGLASFAADMVFGTYIDETTFNVDGDAVELDQNKVYIDSPTNTLYRWNGTSLTKACMWTDRGKVFTQGFSFNILKTYHKENMIVTATAKWVGEAAPTIRMTTTQNGGQLSLQHTMQYIIGAKNNYSTKEWRPYNCLIHQDRVRVQVTIPAGTTLMMDEFTNYYSDKIVKGSYPQFHYRAGCGLNQGLTAWEEAAKLGYEYIIVIPKRTADGKWVIFHDDGDINGMYNEDGTKVTNSSPIGSYTYAELMALDIAGEFPYNGNKLPLLEDFFALCAKRGIHPCFSVHPNFTTQEWQEVRALSDKWGVTKHLNLKSGYIIGSNALLTTCYSVFGDDVESYYVDINRSGNGVSEVQSAISTYGIDTTKVRVGIEYFHAYATDANIQAARTAGIPVSVVTDSPNAAGSGGDTAENILHWIDLGVSGFTDLINPSVGLNW